MAGKKCNRIGKMILSCLLAMAITAAPHSLYFVPVHAADITDTESTKKELEEQKEALNQQLEEVQKDAEDQRAQKDVIDQQIGVVQKQIALNTQQATQLDEEIAALEEQIAGKQEEIDEGMDVLKKRLRAIYMAGESSTIDIILQSTDVNDFLDKVMIVKSITTHDTQLIQELKDSMALIQKEKDAIDQKREEVAQTKLELEQQQDELNALLEKSESLLEELQGSEQQLMDDLDENNAQLQEIEDKIQQYYEQKRKEEEERIKKEQAEQNNQGNNSSAEQGNSGDNGSNGNSSGGDVVTPPDNSGVTEGDLAWPVPGYTHLTSSWGDGRNHGAIDIAQAGIYGKPVVAAGNGTVIAINTTCTHDFPKEGAWDCHCGGGYGNYVMIAHDDGTLMTVYAHLSAVGVQEGQHVSRGQVIGNVGTTGRSSGAHLHYEVRVNGVKQDPMKWY